MKATTSQQSEPVRLGYQSPRPRTPTPTAEQDDHVVVQVWKEAALVAAGWLALLGLALWTLSVVAEHEPPRSATDREVVAPSGYEIPPGPPRLEMEVTR